MYGLASVGDLPLPNSAPPPSNKRERNADDSPASTTAADTIIMSPLLSPDPNRSIAGSGRVKERMRQSSLPTELTKSLGNHTPPTPSKEGLGHPPVVHGEATFLSQSQFPVHHAPDINFPDGSISTGSMQAYTSPPHESLSFMDDLVFDSIGSNYDAFDAESFPPSSSPFGTVSSSSSLPILHSAEVDHHHHQVSPALGSGIPGLMNEQAMMIDNDPIAMWSSAPSGFEYVLFSFFFLRLSLNTLACSLRGAFFPPAA